MYLVLLTALVAVCGGDKLDRTYLPPATAHIAGGSPGTLQTPFRSFNQGLGGLPKGGYSNNFEGVVVDAAAPGTRASGSDESGLGAPRIVYGSSASKVGDAAFTAHAFPRVGVHSSLNDERIPGNPVIGGQNPNPVPPERIQASRDRASNTVKYENDVSHDSFNYAFETDNGIIAEENGVEINGVKAQGGYSYTGDDGQVYSVTYTADESGYRPRGDHLPTPPPIPEEILKSLEQNAKDEASGVSDDGSYDVQKYNTEEDYTKSDSANEKYNGGQPSRLGIRPQSDTDPSASFISQNNQGFRNPSVNQFSITPTKSPSTDASRFHSFDSSKIEPSNNNNFRVISSDNRASQNGQPLFFGSGSIKEYLPPSFFSQDRRPVHNNRLQGIQSDVQSGFPQHTQSGVNNNAGSSNNQNTQTLNSVPLSQQELQEDSPKRPQSSSSVFGKPSVIDSTLSIKDPFARRPSSTLFTQNKQNNQSPQIIGQTGGSFEVVSGNVYSSKNEYLPPRSQLNNIKQKDNPDFQTTSSGKLNSPSVSAFASISRPTLGFPSSHQYNVQKAPQFTYTGTPSQLTQMTNSRRPINKAQLQYSSGLPSVPSSSNIPVSQSQYKPTTFASHSPTLQPQTELTTPLESNGNQNKGAGPGPVLDGPDTPSLLSTSSSNLPLFGAQPTSSFLGQSSFNTYKTQNILPTQASAYAYSSINRGSNLDSQFLNKSPNDVQYSSSTQRPLFSQQKDSDDSYYYNPPSKPFNIPTARPQIPRFPSSSFDQSIRVTQTPFGTRPQFSAVPQASFTLQGSEPTGTTRYPTLKPVSPTLPSQQATFNSFQSDVNRVTQASASPFPSPVPTASADIHKNQFSSQLSTRLPQQTKPQINAESQGSSSPNQPGLTFDQTSANIQQFVQEQEGNHRLPALNLPSSTQKQQYNGELYEYKKPPQTLPVSQNGAGSGQFSQTAPSNLPSSQASQSDNTGAYKPSPQFENKLTSQTVSSFGQRPQSSLISQGNQAYNLNFQLQSQPQSDSKPGVFGSLSLKPVQDSDIHQEKQTLNLHAQKQVQSQSQQRPGVFGSIPSKPTSIFQGSQGNQAYNQNDQVQTLPQADSIPEQFSSVTSKPSQNSEVLQENQGLNFNAQQQNRPYSEQRPEKFNSRPSAQTQSFRPIQGASKFPPAYNNEGPPCCKQPNLSSQSKQSDSQNQRPQFDEQIGANQDFTQKQLASQGTKPQSSVSSFASVGESFGGPRKPPSFDENGYHY